MERAAKVQIITVFTGWNQRSLSKSKAKIISDRMKTIRNPTVMQKKLSWNGCFPLLS